MKFLIFAQCNRSQPNNTKMLVWCLLWTTVNSIRVPSTWNQQQDFQNPFNPLQQNFLYFPQRRSDQFNIPAIQPSVLGLANHDKYIQFKDQQLRQAQLNHMRQFSPSPKDAYLSSTTEPVVTVTEGYRNQAASSPKQSNGADRNRIAQWDDKSKSEPPSVPTKPLYPGEGLWAKPGFPHRPHISQHKFLELNDQSPKPAGYDVFEQLNSYFDGGFGQKSYLPPDVPAGNVQVKPPRTLDVVAYDPFKDSKPDTSNQVVAEAEVSDDVDEGGEAADDEFETDDESTENDEEEEEFVPLRLYSQVRKSEDIEHEPYNPLEHGRLREVIKDSKVQTVYTEEGYEDSAYDHAGHEKKAEQDQGFSQFEREKEGKGVPLDSDSSAAASEADKPAKNFISTEEVKTTQVMDKDNGDVQLEIESEVKMVLQPNNTTKTHKYVKIYPKVVMDVSSTPTTTTNKLQQLHHEINDMADLDSTTQSSTVSFLEAMTKDQSTTSSPRQKRASGSGFEDVDVNEFLDKTQFAPAKPEVDVDKYPYYVMPGIDENSPLRYAENLGNIPDKKPGELSFYKDKERLPCPDFETILIPDKVINAKREKRQVDDGEEDEEDEEEVSTPQTPRIHLGDKIDCLKARYFGEEPLDSPFFKEETVGPVKPIFQELDRPGANRRESLENDKAESVVNVVTTPTPLSLMTTPKYTLQLTPENIYDQIELLEHLPSDDNSRQAKSLPDAEPLRRRRLRPKRPSYQIFDVNRYLTTTPFTLINPPSTVLPKHKVLSEVFYKDDIKPNEQLTVFADVLNIIRNSSMEESTSDFAEPKGVAMKNTINLRPFKPSGRGRKKNTTTTTTIRSTNINVPSTSETTPSNHQPFVIDYIEDNEVVGLVPPHSNYKTIVDRFDERDADDAAEAKPVTEDTEEVIPRPMNKYYFIGLKPPIQTKARPYSDFSNHIQVNDNLLLRRISHVGLSRVRRAAARPYADLSRNRGSQSEGLLQVDEDDDDYVPHRPKNYHYDENTGKIVYHSQPAAQEEDEEEEELIPDTPGVYLERAEDATHPTPEKVTTKPLLATATPPPAGQGLMDFVLKLKNSEGYKFIPDPTTRKPGEQDLATVQSTKPPEFLSILSKVKTDKNYKIIEDPKEVKTTTAAEPDEEDDEDVVPTRIQNAPGGQAQDLANIQIFDIGDYLPKVKTFTPRTTIDYSKYKTINRPHRPRPAEDDEDEEEKEEVSRPPIREGVTRRPFNRYKSGRPITEEVKIYTKEPTTTQKIVQLRRGTTPIRRRPKTTTEVLETTEKVQRVYPENYSPEPLQSATHDKVKRVYRRRPVRIRHTTERDVEDKEDVDRIMRRSIEVDELEEVLVTPPAEESYDQIKEDILNDKKEEDMFDKREAITEKMEEDNNEDDDKEDDEKEKQEVPIKIQKHGGNYRQTKQQEKAEEQTNKNVDQKDKFEEEEINTETHSKPVEIIDKKYNKTKKHGGNYKEDNVEEEIQVKPRKAEEVKKEQKLIGNNDDKGSKEKHVKHIEIIDENYDKSKKHGGNYRAIDVQKTTKRRRKIKIKKPQRLSDVVPKPDHFYSDPQLPKMVNQLRSAELSSDELSKVALESDLSKEVQRRNFEVTTKKPLFIKDPSKRLYFYAPI